MVVVTSAAQGEGKTTLAVALAASAVAAGARVLAIDGDLAEGGLSRHFGMSGEHGLTDILRGGALSDMDPGDDGAGLFVIPAGRHAVLGGGLDPDAVGELLRDARSRFDLVVVDAPSVNDSADALALAALADAVGFVSRWQDTPRTAVSAALRRIGRPKVRGVAINMAGAAPAA